ncbi:MAG: hypothetical protein AAGF68_05525, partial [Pseudomonadota bacterium]
MAEVSLQDTRTGSTIPARLARALRGALPVLSVVLAIIVVWYLACIPMNRAWTEDRAPDGVELAFSDILADIWVQER